MILADVGNRHVHIWEDGHVSHLAFMDAIEQYGTDEVHYINVSCAHSDTLAALDGWVDISDRLSIEGEYEGMGVDRKALCLSHDDGVFVDAGSAITVDRVAGGIYQGGFILPGIHAYAKAYATISPILDQQLNRAVDLAVLPKSTRDSVSFGTIAPIVAVIGQISAGTPLYFTGGDGAYLSRYFEDAIWDETLLFNGMKKRLKRKI
jgi:type III pantothenate kinase